MRRFRRVLVAAAVGVVALPAAGTTVHASLPLPAPSLPPVPGSGNNPLPGLPQLPGLTTNEVAPADQSPAAIGSFSRPYAEPGPNCPNETQGGVQAVRNLTCKPAGVSVVQLANGKLVYWDGLEGQETVNLNDVAEFGDKAVEDQSRVMTLPTASTGASWVRPTPNDGGANGSAYTDYLVPNAPGPLKPVLNDPGQAQGALFCSDQVLLADGEVLTTGGTHYYAEPRIPGTPYGVVELEGLRSTRIFDPSNNTWRQSSDMNYGRWYGSLVTLADGTVFVASGVTKLIKPVYTNDPAGSLTNVKQTETYNPQTGTWSYNGAAADKSLPLFPRLHLLPDGNVYYDAAGQTFNPFGQSYDEALWNMASVFNPTTKSWKDVGIPAGLSLDPSTLNAGVTAGFRGSSFSVMLPMSAPYTSASFLSAGGVLGVTPGAYVANTSSVIDTITTTKGDALTSTATSPLNNARWYSTGVVLPTGQVMIFSGANRDEVVLPGTGFPIHQSEMFNPSTGTWTRMASETDDRTYHNTAILLPDGRILVGGSAPIATGYSANYTIPGGFSNNFRDPSFELYSPPYLFWGPRPTITAAPATIGHGHTFTIETPDAASIQSVALTRNTALTHLIDGDQRTLDLTIVSRTATTLTVAEPPSTMVAPAGPYLLFINKGSAKGLIPSVAAQLTETGTALLPVRPGAISHGAAVNAAGPATAPAGGQGATLAAAPVSVATDAAVAHVVAGAAGSTRSLAALPASRLLPAATVTPAPTVARLGGLTPILLAVGAGLMAALVATRTLVPGRTGRRVRRGPERVRSRRSSAPGGGPPAG